MSGTGCLNKAGNGRPCMRRLVFYAAWPRRAAWRQARRALSFLLERTLEMDAVWSLADARSDVENKLWPGYSRRDAQAAVTDAAARAPHFKGLQLTWASALKRLRRRRRVAGAAFFSEIAFTGHWQVRGLQLKWFCWLYAAACSMRCASAGNMVWSFTGLSNRRAIVERASSCVLGLEEHEGH